MTLFYAVGIAIAFLFAKDIRSAVALAAVGGVLICTYFVSFGGGTIPKRLPLICVLIFVYGLFGSYFALSEVDPLEKYAQLSYENVPEEYNLPDDKATPGETIPLQHGAVVQIATEREYSMDMVVRVSEKKGRLTKHRNVLLRVKGQNLNPVDYIEKKVSFTGKVELPAGARNPGCFDNRTYLLTKEIRVIVISQEAQVVIDPLDKNIIRKFANKIMQAKYSFLSRLQTAMTGDGFGVLSGMLFGDKSEISEDLYEAFQMNGLAHLLCVSGLHVAIVYAAIERLFRKRKSVPIAAVQLSMLFFYMFLSEFSPSVMRAGIMITVHIVAKVTVRRYDLLTGTCASALILLVANPLKLLHPGFKFSFLCVLVIAVAMPFAGRFIGFVDLHSGVGLSFGDMQSRDLAPGGRIMRLKIAKAFISLLILQLAMAPMTAYTFNTLPLIGMLLNLPFVAIAGAVLTCGLLLFILCAASDIFPILAGFLRPLFQMGASAESLLIEQMTRLTRAVDALPLSGIRTVSPPLPLLILCYAAFFFLMTEQFRIIKSRRQIAPLITSIALIAILTASLGFSLHTDTARPAFTFVDVGQGDCLHIRTPDGRNYLVDGGGSIDYNVGKRVLLPYLLKNGVGRLDGVFVSHLHTDHFRGIQELSQCMNIGKVYVYEGNTVKTEAITSGSAIEPGDIAYLAGGDRVNIGKGVSVEILFPPRSEGDYESLMLAEDDENKNSLLMRVDYEGVTALMTGDMGEEGEAQVLSSDVSADILKVGHHGSKTSTGDTFLRAVNPKIALIQVGHNTFGHPTSDVLEKLYDRDIIVLRNDLSGAIKLDIEKGKIVEVSSCEPWLPPNGKRYKH